MRDVDLGNDDGPHYAADRVRDLMEQRLIPNATIFLGPTDDPEETCFLYREGEPPLRILGDETTNAFDFPSCDRILEAIVGYAVTGWRQASLQGAFRSAGLSQVHQDILASIAEFTAVTSPPRDGISFVIPNPNLEMNYVDTGSLEAHASLMLEQYGTEYRFAIPSVSAGVFLDRMWSCAECTAAYANDQVVQSFFLDLETGGVTAAMPVFSGTGINTDGGSLDLLTVSRSSSPEDWGTFVNTMGQLESYQYVLSRYRDSGWVLDTPRDMQVVYNRGQIPEALPQGIVDFFVMRQTPIENLPPEFRSAVIYREFE